MTPSSRLVDLLLRYEELQQQGQHVTPEELCRDDPDLLDAVREELKGLARVDAFLQTTTLSPPVAHPSPSAASPEDQRFHVVNLHARGGLGEVHLAVDRQLNREVALKQMQGHLADHPDLRRRFLLEAEVTGRLEHPGIVPVYGLGADSRGRPYYAMRFIRGDSLLQAINRFHAADTPERDPGERSLALRQLLTRFVAVCNAVAYAHSRGIIHRDIKPANVMLGPYGETLVVDWGLARPIRRSDADRASGELTLYLDNRPSATVGIVGTPAYMAPEQAAGRLDEMGPTSDVCSLGSTLYHLLTGEPPFEADRTTDVLAQVKTGAFLPPSGRKKGVPRALEAICLKAMAMDPADRYITATDLGKDVEAWLADEPISARPDPLRERLRRWLKRRRTAVMATLAAGAVALVALAVSTVLLRSAYTAEQTARTAAETSEQEASEQRDRAEDAFRLATRTSGNLLGLAEDIRPAPGTQSITLKRILEKASSQYDDLRRVAGDRPEVIEGKARVLTALSDLEINLGSTRRALDSAREAEELYRLLLRRDPASATWRAGLATARERAGIALSYRGQLAEARQGHGEARDLRRKLVEESPDEPRWQIALGGSHTHLGNLDNAHGDTESAAREYARSLALRQKAAARAPDNLAWQPLVAMSLEKVADAHSSMDDLTSAEKHYQEALKVLDAALRRDGANSEWHRQRTALALSLGMTVQYLGRTKEALALMEQALARAQLFAQLDPAHTEWQRLVLQARVYRANLVVGNDQKALLAEMLAVFRELLPLAEKRARLDPDNAEWQVHQASCRLHVAWNLIALVRLKVEPRSALHEVERQVTLAQKELTSLRSRFPDHHTLMMTEVRLHLAQAFLFDEQGQKDRADAAKRRIGQTQVAYYERQLTAEPESNLWVARLVDALGKKANTLNLQSGGQAEGVEASRRAVVLGRQLVSRRPDRVSLQAVAGVLDTHRRGLALLGIRRSKEQHPSDETAAALAAERSAEFAERESCFFELMEVHARLAALEPRNPTWQWRRASAYRELASQRRRTGDDAGATAAFACYLAVVERLFELVPQEAQRDPFAAVQQTSRAELMADALHGKDRNPTRHGLQMCEMQYGLLPRSERAGELIDRLIDLVVRLEQQKPIPTAEVRLALRRGVALLRRLEAMQTLPRPLAVVLPFFEKRLAALPAPEKELPPELRRAHDRMAYGELARALVEKKQTRELVLILDREARRVSSLAWAQQGVNRVVLEELAGDTHLGVILKEAVALQDEKALALSAAGKKLLARLALYGGDAEAARRLDRDVARIGLEETVVIPLAEHLRQRGQADAAQRLMARWEESHR
jgi:serine/threonine-protein kinase